MGGQTYSLASYNDNPIAGIGVAIFDPSNFFNPGRYAVGFLQNPVQDGAGFISDFSSASPAFSTASQTGTVFMNYNGVGFGPGGNGAVTPIPLFDSGNSVWLLTLKNYSEGGKSATLGQ